MGGERAVEDCLSRAHCLRHAGASRRAAPPPARLSSNSERQPHAAERAATGNQLDVTVT